MSENPETAYRRWYSHLHPSLQVIGMQLWMPVFLIVMFCLCYVGAFQSTHPHDVPVAVVGPVSTLQQRADTAEPGAFAFERYGSAEAERAVLAGTVGAAYEPTTGTILVAAAHQAQAASMIPALLTPVLSAGGHTPMVKDLAPLPAGDLGMTPMYLMLTWCIGGYLTAMFIGMMGGPLRHRVRISVIVGLSLLLSLLADVLVVPVLGAIHGHFLALWGLGWAWMTAIGLAVNGLGYFFGRFVALPSLVIFIFLSIPSSGAAFPKWFVPEPFAWLNNVVVGSGITEMLKRLVYDVGPGYARGWIMMGCYAAGGVLLALVGKRIWEHQQVSRILSGRTTMFQDAQKANGEFIGKMRDAILARHGLPKTTTGPIRAMDEQHRGPGPSAQDMFLEPEGLTAPAPVHREDRDSHR